MRRGPIAMARVLLVASAGVIADVTVPFAQVVAGSFSTAPRAEGLQLAFVDSSCKTPSGSVCVGRYAYAPGRQLTAWFSVRNDSPVPITLDGVPDSFFKQYPAELLMRPLAALDGGDPLVRVTLTGTPFRPVVLAPQAQRLVGVVFRTTGDVAYACAHWQRGGAISWERLPVEWHWAMKSHEAAITLQQPVELATPTAKDCGS